MRRGIRNLGLQRYCSPHLSARRCGFDIEFPAKLEHALAHAKDSHTQPGSSAVSVLAGALSHSSSLIHDFEANAIRIAAQLNLGRLAGGMPLDVRKAFLHDAEERCLRLLRQTPKSRL